MMGSNLPTLFAIVDVVHLKKFGAVTLTSPRHRCLCSTSSWSVPVAVVADAVVVDYDPRRSFRRTERSFTPDNLGHLGKDEQSIFSPVLGSLVQDRTPAPCGNFSEGSSSPNKWQLLLPKHKTDVNVVVKHHRRGAGHGMSFSCFLKKPKDDDI